MNQAFRQLVNSLGGTFSWGSTTTGHFGPLQVQGTFATMNQNVPVLDTFYDGCAGSGDNTIFPFLSYGGNDYGFCFCPSNAAWGKIITTTDQGWVFPPTANDLGLVENVDYHLITPTLCGILLQGDMSQSNVSCHGGADGAASVSPIGLYPPFTYLWYPGNQTTASISGLSAGTYICTVTDSLNNVIHDTFTITEPAAINATVLQANVACYGDATGNATVNVSGGTPGYNYQWAPSGGNTASASGLTAGNYTCTITDSNNCVFSQNVNITQPASALAASITHSDVSCTGAGNGSAMVTVSGGTPAYTYQWSPGGGNAATANNLSAGVYTCTITDNNNCTHTETVTINDAVSIIALDSQENVSCYGYSDGYAMVTVSGGSAPYTYQWTPTGGNASMANNLHAGSYTCTISDANNCIVSSIVVIAEPTPLTASASVTNIFCQNDTTGIIVINVLGGTSPYTYSWTPVNNAGNIAADLGVGTYTCIVTDAGNCSDTVSAAISNLSTTINANFSYEPLRPIPGKDISFHNQSSANASSFYWSFGDGAISSEADPVIMYNDSGLYHVCMIASDTNNCADTICKDISYSIEKSVALPSAFSPNGDGINDVLYIRGYRLKTVRLRIYDRWGVLVFETDNRAKGWDGTYKGQPQVDAVYAYVLEAAFTDGSSKQLRGSVTLLR